MNLPSFLWLWRIAAWSMGLSLLTYFLLAISGSGMFYFRTLERTRPEILRPLHLILGSLLLILVLLLLTVGIVGTLGHYGSLGHSPHLIVGISVVVLVITSAISANKINQYPWLRSVHIGINILLLVGFISVTLTGWTVVQKYLPENL